MRKILIIGVNGFSGEHLVRLLSLSKLNKIYGADIGFNNKSSTPLEAYYKVDIARYQEVKKLIRLIDPDQIYNLAGLFHGSDDMIFKVNILGVVNLLEAIRNFGNSNCSILFVGSSAEYGLLKNYNNPINEETICNPQNPYGVSKLSASIIIQRYVYFFGIKAIIVRPFNIIGPGIPDGLLLGSLLRRVKNAYISNHSYIEVGNVNTYRDFIDVRDAVKIYIKLLESDISFGNIVNVCSGRGVKIEHVVKTVLSILKFELQVRINENYIKSHDVPKIVGDVKTMIRYTSFMPKISLEKSIIDSWEYLENIEK